jgi:EAL domain-containing protein (putative c-di-GMP-specific phosphodiesterase class I)
VSQTTASVSKDGDSIASIGESLAEAIGGQRTQSISLHDLEADILWLSEGVMGPDEHNLVLEAIQALSIVTDRSHIYQNIGDGRCSIFLPARTPLGELVAVATIITECKWLDSAGANKLVNPQTTAVMRRFAILRKPAAASRPAAPTVAPPVAPPTSSVKASQPDLLDADELRLILDDEPITPAAPPRVPAAAKPVIPVVKPATAAKTFVPAAQPAPQNIKPAVRPAAVSPNKSPDKKPAPTAAPSAFAPAKPPTGPRLSTVKPASVKASSSRSSRGDRPALSAFKPIEFGGAQYDLHVQQLLKLRSGGGTRRYEVLARRIGDAGSATPSSISDTVRKKIGTSDFDRHVVEGLLKWLDANSSVWESTPASFSVNLSMSSIEDPKFLAFVASQLKSHGLPAATLGFEISEQACVEQRKDVDLFVAACEKIGCFIVLDDFTMHSSAVPWLASRAVRFVKIDAKITQSAMSEKLSQAMVVAMSQASKVLGISCVAKRIDTPAARQWLQAVGVDYAQGFLLEHPRSLASLHDNDEAQG